MNIKSNSVKFFAVVAFVFGLTVSTANAAYSFPNMIDTAQERMDVQTVLNMVVTPTPNLVVDGKIGAKSIAAVKAFQAMKNLVVDGKIGPMTRAALEAAQTGGTTTTGALCPNGMTLASNCSVSPTGSTSVLTGGAGDITVSNLSSVSNEKVGEGDVDHKVFAFEVEADNGSDIAINSVKVTLTQGNSSGSDKLVRYATNVSVWMGSTKVGSATTASFSEGSSNDYSKSISLAGAVIKADQKASFYVSVDGAANIDSTDLSNNSWTATLESTRFSDATGAILTNSQGSISKTFEFATLASAGDVELKVNLSSSNPAAKTVKVSTTSNTNQVELLKFTMKAQGSSMTIDQIPVNFTTNESDLDEVTSNVTLKIGGNTYNETVSTTSSATTTILFDDLSLSVSKDATVEAIVYADLNDIETSTFDEGTTLAASIPSHLVTTLGANYIDVEDMNGDNLATGDRTGSANGETMTFRSTGVNTVMGTPSYSNTVDTNGNITSVTYNIPVAVTSFGNTLYVGQSASISNSLSSGSNAFGLVFENATAPTTGRDTSVTASVTLSTSNATIESNGFRLDDGVTKNFTISVNLTDPYAYNASFRVRLDQIRTFTEGGLVTATSSDLLPEVNFRTDFKLINN